ncbi:MAG: hypothetical protein JO071_01670 [Deltaproteobacteria bacterium]|nr:hypothetical protein [Deltaproteobacteria bacterium]
MSTGRLEERDNNSDLEAILDGNDVEGVRLLNQDGVSIISGETLALAGETRDISGKLSRIFKLDYEVSWG